MDGCAREQERVKVVNRWMYAQGSKRGLKLSTDGRMRKGAREGNTLGYLRMVLIAGSVWFVTDQIFFVI